MYKILKIYKNNLQHIKYLSILFLFWSSINTGSKYIRLEYLQDEFINNPLNFFRAYAPYLIFFYIIVFEMIIKKKSYKFDSLFYLFFLYGLFQLFGLFKNPINIYEHYWIICLYALLLFFYSFEKAKNIENIIYINNIFFIFFIFLFFIFITFKENIFSINLLYQSSAFDILYNNEKIPRSSGLSRMGLIVFIFLNSLYFAEKVKIQKLYISIINIFLISVIFLLQSRGAILCLLIIFILSNVLYKFESIIQRIKYFIFIILIPIFLFITYSNGKIFLVNEFGGKKEISQPKKKLKIKNLEIDLRKDFVLENNGDNTINKIYAFSNNRMNAWEFLLQIFINSKINENMKKKLIKSGYKPDTFQKIKNKNYLTGYGPQADRYLLKNESKLNASKNVIGPFGAHASNGYVYSLICSGILGLITFTLINFIIFFKIIRLIFHYKLNFKTIDPFLASSIFILIFLQFRVLFENSFSVFGVDLIMLISSYLIVQKHYRSLQF